MQDLGPQRDTTLGSLEGNLQEGQLVINPIKYYQPRKHYSADDCSEYYGAYLRILYDCDPFWKVCAVPLEFLLMYLTLATRLRPIDQGLEVMFTCLTEKSVIFPALTNLKVLRHGIAIQYCLQVPKIHLVKLLSAVGKIIGDRPSESITSSLATLQT